MLNNVGTYEEVDPVEVFKHLKKLNLFEGNVKALSDIEDTVIGELINKKVDQHNTKAKNRLKSKSPLRVVFDTVQNILIL